MFSGARCALPWDVFAHLFLLCAPLLAFSEVLECVIWCLSFTGRALHCCYVKYPSCSAHSFHTGFRLCRHILPQQAPLERPPLLQHIRTTSRLVSLLRSEESLLVCLCTPCSLPSPFPGSFLLQQLLFCHLCFASSLFPCFFQFLFAEISRLIMHVTHFFVTVFLTH